MDRNGTGYGSFCSPWPLTSCVECKGESAGTPSFHATWNASKIWASLRLLFLRQFSVEQKVCACIKRRSNCIYLACPTQKCRRTSCRQDIRVLDSYLHCTQFCVSNQGSPFVPKLLMYMAADYNFRHRPTVTYKPQSNITGERLSREVL